MKQIILKNLMVKLIQMTIQFGVLIFIIHIF
jgi:hypothetical protein